MLDKSKQKRQTLERYASILEIVASSNTLSLTQIAEVDTLPKATAHRLLSALVKVGFLETVGAPRPMYKLGNRLLRLLYGGGDSALVARIASPFLEVLADKFNESSFMTRLNGTKVETLIRVAPSKRISSYVVPGSVMPPHSAASAKAIVAFQSEHLINTMLSQPLEAYTRFTKCDPQVIRAEYCDIRKDGYSVCDRELDDWLLAFAVPVRQPGNHVFYAITLSGPVNRLKKTPKIEIITSLKSAAEQIASEINRRLRTEPPQT